MKSQTLIKIDAALRWLKDGTYGVCFECGGEIAERRLWALPFAVPCKDCEDTREIAERHERAMARRGSSSPFGEESLQTLEDASTCCDPIHMPARTLYEWPTIQRVSQKTRGIAHGRSSCQRTRANWSGTTLKILLGRYSNQLVREALRIARGDGWQKNRFRRSGHRAPPPPWVPRPGEARERSHGRVADTSSRAPYRGRTR
jgi:hypothetical protein